MKAGLCRRIMSIRDPIPGRSRNSPVTRGSLRGYSLVIWALCLALSLSACAPTMHVRDSARARNLVPNPEFREDRDGDGCPDGWSHGIPLAGDWTPSRFGSGEFRGSGAMALWVEGGNDRRGEWYCTISGIEPDTDYLLTFWAYRQVFLNKIYPEVEIMGRSFRLDNHCTARGWQYFRIPLRSGRGMHATTLSFINPYPLRFYFHDPCLIEIDSTVKPLSPLRAIPIPMGDFFPIGIYGARIEALQEIRSAGFNTVLVSPGEEMVAAAQEVGLKVVLSLCSDGDPSRAVRKFRDHPALLAWYIADEPELKSITPEMLRAHADHVMAWDSTHPTCMAVVRPRFVKQYRDACHIVMLDQYPIPSQPLTWLSDSLDEACREVGTERIWAVIQAFGGDEYAAQGWPVFPTYDEMRSLAYLAIVHDAQGLFFYSYRSARAEGERWEILARVADELRRLSGWLLQSPQHSGLSLTIRSPFTVDAMGDAAVHYQWKVMKDEGLLVMVNTIDKEVKISLDGLPPHITGAAVLFEDRKVALKEGNLRDVFGPHQTHLYHIEGIVSRHSDGNG
ncbi:MAG: hypothetical protein ACMUIS_11075 [bacterium]